MTMTPKWRRVCDLVELLGNDRGFEIKDDKTSPEMRDAETVFKGDMQKTLRILGYDDSGTVQELRARLRENVTHRTDKSDVSKFSSREVRDMHYAVSRARRLDADELRDLAKNWSGKLIVNGEEYHIRSNLGADADPPAYYDAYRILRIGRRKRVILLYNLDTDKCTYRSNVVLEKKVDYSPYERWKKVEYVYELINEENDVVLIGAEG